MKYEARVVGGRGRGRRIRVPTLNLEIPEHFDYAHGIYAGFVWIDQVRHEAAFHFGPIPTFKESKPVLEAHVLNAEIVNPPKEVTFEIVKRIRDIKTFESTQELVREIQSDIEETRKILRAFE